jgi:phage N-6-adenine-methyltransferase
MISQYVDELRATQLQETHLAKQIGDQWRTPDWLFHALDYLYGPLILDLFTDGQNTKCASYFTAEDNALTQDWEAALNRAAGGWFTNEKAFGNPPYSIKRAARGRKAPHLTGMQYIMRKAHEEHLKGVPSIWITKSATAENWWPDELCTQICPIKGRIGFEPPVWYRPDPLASDTTSAGFGAAVIIFDGESSGGRLPEKYLRREELMEIGMPLAKANEADRDRWIKLWDEI